MPPEIDQRNLAAFFTVHYVLPLRTYLASVFQECQNFLPYADFCHLILQPTLCLIEYTAIISMQLNGLCSKPISD